MKDLYAVPAIDTNDEVDYDGVDYDGNLEFFVPALNRVTGFDELKRLMMNLCLPEDDDNSCDFQATYDSDSIIDITIINIGSDLSSFDEFSCAADGGIHTNNYIEYEDLYASMNNNRVRVVNEICTNIKPTSVSLPSGEPTPNLTGVPTKKKKKTK